MKEGKDRFVFVTGKDAKNERRHSMNKFMTPAVKRIVIFRNQVFTAC